RILDALIDREIDRGIPADRIVVAGFSQGGAIAVHNVLRTERAPAGLMALSTYLPVLLTDEEEAAAKAGAASVTVPVFAAHGTFDPMVRYQWGRDSASLLESLGYAVEWHEYPMLHGVCPQEIADISDWLQRVYSP
ncbi:MAG: alpha/beta hydrolase, partial [Woeseiaceae bacterium]